MLLSEVMSDRGGVCLMGVQSVQHQFFLLTFFALLSLFLNWSWGGEKASTSENGQSIIWARFFLAWTLRTPTFRFCRVGCARNRQHLGYLLGFVRDAEILSHLWASIFFFTKSSFSERLKYLGISQETFSYFWETSTFSSKGDKKLSLWLSATNLFCFLAS